jgi:hypothetical protein
MNFNRHALIDQMADSGLNVQGITSETVNGKN